MNVVLIMLFSVIYGISLLIVLCHFLERNLHWGIIHFLIWLTPIINTIYMLTFCPELSIKEQINEVFSRSESRNNDNIPKKPFVYNKFNKTYSKIWHKIITE